MPTHRSEDKTSQNSFASLYKRCLEDIQRRLDRMTTLTAETFRPVVAAVRGRLGKSREICQEDLDQVIDTRVKHWQQMLTHGVHVREEPLRAGTMKTFGR